LAPLTRVRAAWTEKEGRDLHRIDSLESARSFAVMQSDPAIQAACAVFCKWPRVRPGKTSRKQVFRLLGAILESLEAGLHPWIAVRYFEYWMLRLHGILPEVAACAACGRSLSDADPGFVAPRDGLRCRRAPADPSRPATLAYLSQLSPGGGHPSPSRMGAHLNAAKSGSSSKSFS